MHKFSSKRQSEATKADGQSCDRVSGKAGGRPTAVDPVTDAPGAGSRLALREDDDDDDDGARTVRTTDEKRREPDKTPHRAQSTYGTIPTATGRANPQVPDTHRPGKRVRTGPQPSQTVDTHLLGSPSVNVERENTE